MYPVEALGSKKLHNNQIGTKNQVWITAYIGLIFYCLNAGNNCVRYKGYT